MKARTVRGLVLLGASTIVVVLLLVLRGTFAGAKSRTVPTVGSGSSAAGPMPAGSGSAGDRIVPVTVAKVERRDVPVVLEGLGSVLSLASVTVRSQVDGRLDKLAFVEGQPVKKGDVLALVDPRPYAIQRQQAEATLARDTAALDNAKLNYKRFEAMRQEGLVSQQELDNARAAVDQAAASTRADQAQIDSARLLLDYARITSPIDGVTGIRLVDQGNIVRASDTTGIVVVTQIDPIGVVFTLPQDELPRVKAAMKEGKVVVDGYARDGIQKLGVGEVLLVDNQVNAQTATIRLKATMPNPEGLLWPNAFVKARMHLTTIRAALVVPASAVQRGPNGTFAYVVEKGDVVATRPIEVASIQGETAIIAKGLGEGDSVVSDGQNQIRPGSRVSPRDGRDGRKSGRALDGGAPDFKPEATAPDGDKPRDGQPVQPSGGEKPSREGRRERRGGDGPKPGSSAP